MEKKLEIIYNENCPVCRFEINHYKTYAAKKNLSIKFIDLNNVDLKKWNLTKDKAAQRLYAFDQGKKYEGVSAFNILWSKMPRYKFLAFIVQIPILNKASNITYDKILAPIIYKMHLKRELKKSINAKAAR